MIQLENPTGGMLDGNLQICTHDEEGLVKLPRGHIGCLRCLAEWTHDGRLTPDVWRLYRLRVEARRRLKPSIGQTLLALASLLTLPFLGGADE